MHTPPPELSANPLTLVRSLPTKLIPLDQIGTREGIITDEIFRSKYAAFLLGKAPIHETRVSLSTIRRGFWKKAQSGWNLIEDPIPVADLDHIIDMIRLGDRPALHLYENPNPADGKKLVCADDAALHAAYEKLGISKVPAVLMAKPRDLEESCLSVRYFPCKGKPHVSLLDGFVPVAHETAPSILGKKKPPIKECLDQLSLALAETMALLKRFHRPGATKLHYHHTLYSVLLRASECIDSMRLLVISGKQLAAAGLLRSLYELTLVFYVDWLSPGHVYRYLQMASVISEKEWEATRENWNKSYVSKGASPIEAKNIKDAHMRAFRLGRVIGERARLFPLGEKFQRDVYSFLSDVVHHDFSMTARYTHTLDHGDEAIYHEDVVQTIAHLADILVAAMVSRIRDDIGDMLEGTTE
ncbi:hypothetical protein [Ralstonia pseudosolanacearum]|uniref:hypothetical protein n=1 Tax=Ralstonia pseudosolanacearum TaxID=1310165 RepID=UPI0018D1AA1B|nr:hypothetical protein [Ralstonia pseudosolanacearum]